jgi:predicted Rossmann-fold nucleotide-binding protein
VTPELSFTQHYFHSRKNALCWPSRALVVCPGGFGTFDELFEVLTLIQSGKIDEPQAYPVVLFGEAYWKQVIAWESLISFGVISKTDVDRLFFTDSVESAFDYITSHLIQWEGLKKVESSKLLRQKSLEQHSLSESMLLNQRLVAEALKKRKDTTDAASSSSSTETL